MKKNLLILLVLGLLGVALFFLLHTSKTKASFSYYRSITVDHTKVNSATGTTSPLTNFPVGVIGTYTYLKTIGNGGKVQNANGYDVGFYTNSDCSTGKLAWDTEMYTASTGQVVYWVKISSLSSLVDTVFYMCYGDATISSDQSNAAGTWDSNFKGVWHLGEPSGNAVESTSNGYTGTNTAITYGASGAIGNSYSYNGSTSVTDVPTFYALDSNATPITLDFWYNGASQSNKTFLQNVPYDPNFLVYSRSSTQISNYSSSGAEFGATFSQDSNWHHMVIEIARAIYIDGASTTVSNISGSFGNIFSTGVLKFGNGFGAYSGKLDEIRISITDRQPDWISAEYNNESSPSTFYAIGNENNLSSPTQRVVIFEKTQINSKVIIK